MNVAEALAVLKLAAVPGSAELTRAYRNAAVHAHPDTGGSAEAFNIVKQARDILAGAVDADAETEDQMLKRTGFKNPCAMCRGRGTVVARLGSRICDQCDGSGWR